MKYGPGDVLFWREGAGIFGAWKFFLIRERPRLNPRERLSGFFS